MGSPFRKVQTMSLIRRFNMMKAFPRRPSARSAERGFTIVETLVTMVLVIIILVAISKIFLVQKASGIRLVEQGTAYKSADDQLFALLNLTWSDPALTVGKHSSGNFSWQVTAVDTRIVQITVEAAFLQPVQQTATPDGKQGVATGFKYNDF